MSEEKSPTNSGKGSKTQTALSWIAAIGGLVASGFASWNSAHLANQSHQLEQQKVAFDQLVSEQRLEIEKLKQTEDSRLQGLAAVEKFLPHFKDYHPFMIQIATEVILKYDDSLGKKIIGLHEGWRKTLGDLCARRATEAMTMNCSLVDVPNTAGDRAMAALGAIVGPGIDGGGGDAGTGSRSPAGQSTTRGWVYLGSWRTLPDSRSFWETSYFALPSADNLGETSPAALEGRELVIPRRVGDVNFRQDMPSPEGRFGAVRRTLAPGTRVKVLAAPKMWQQTSFCWAQVEVLGN